MTTLKLKSEIYFLTSIFSPPSGLHTLWGFWRLLGCWHWSFLSLGGKKVALKFFLWGKISHLLPDNQVFSPFFWFGLFCVIQQSCAGLAVIYIFLHVCIHLNIDLFIHGIFWCLSRARHCAKCRRWCSDYSRRCTYLHGAVGPLGSIKLGRKLYPLFIV